MIRTILSSGLIRRLVIMALSATLAATLSVAAFTSTGAAQATWTYKLWNVTGFGEGYTERAIPNPPPPAQRVLPLLNTFYFQYVRCGAHTAFCFGQIDHHISQISILPYSGPTGDTLHLAFGDKGFDNLYNYNVKYYVLSNPNSVYPARIRPFDTGYIKDEGIATTTIPRPPTPASDWVFVLLGFHFAYSLEDHHINRVGILENNGTVTVDFNDKSFNDPFEYRIWYAYVPREFFSSLGERNGTDAGGFAQQDIPPGPAVIRGFLFDFQEPGNAGDHHIKDIAVANQGGRLQVGYADKNDDDAFNWRVRWGILK